ncbi:MAG: hypothetical protein CL878_07255, partial [Dehalococcoidia bacterium]|nr:hypothetical protein [Dehalococcoidia bacterium]
MARALAARGHSVAVLVPPYDHPAEAGRRWRAGKAAVHSLPLPLGASADGLKQAPGLALLSLRLARSALACRPDIVHLSKPKGVSGTTHLLLRWWRAAMSHQCMAAHAGERQHPALVVDADDWEGHGGWNENEGAYAGWQKEVIDRQEHWGLQHADAITVASRALRDRAIALGQHAESVVYLPNGLSPEDYSEWVSASGQAVRSRLGLGKQPTIVLYTRFFEFGPERPARVLAAVRAHIPDAVLFVVGAGKYGQERRLQMEARSLGLEDSLHVAGWLDRASLPGALRAADVALVPADDTLANRAKCSMKLAELLWLGLPVVAERVGEHSSYIDHAITGLLVPPGNDQALASALVTLLRDPDRAARLGAAGHQRIARGFSWEHLALRAEAAYAAALRTDEPSSRTSPRPVPKSYG